MLTTSLSRSRIPVRASSCPQSPKPRHLRLLHSGLITIPEGSRQSSADNILTKMPRVTRSDSLYNTTIDKVLPQLPQSDIIPEVTPQFPITATIRKVSDTSTTEETATTILQVKPPIPTETMPYEDSAWQDFHIQDQKLTRWTLSTNLKTAMDQTSAHLTEIIDSRVKSDCLILLYKAISEINSKLQPHCQRIMDQHQALHQKESQLRNASDYVLKHNEILINKCHIFLTDTTTSYAKLQDTCEKALAHAKESSIAQQGIRVPKDSDVCKDLEALTALNTNISIVVENIVSINQLLESHKLNLDTQIDKLNAEIIKLASKRSSGLLRRMLCFQ